MQTVISVAPTDPSKIVQKSNIARNILIIQGTHDGDAPYGGQSVAVYEYVNAWSKHFLWVHGANHAFFLEGALDKDALNKTMSFGLTEEDLETQLLPRTQLIAGNQYIAMYLLWNSAGKSLYMDVFRGLASVDWKVVDEKVYLELQNKLRVCPRYLHGLARMPLNESPAHVQVHGFLQDNIPISYPDNPPVYGPVQKGHWTCLYQSADGMTLQWNMDESSPLPSFSHPKIVVECNPEVMELLPSAVEFHAVLLGGTFESLSEPWPLQIHAQIKSKGADFGLVPVYIQPSLTMNSKTPVLGIPRTRSMLATVRIPFDRWGINHEKVAEISTLTLTFLNASSPTGTIVIGGFRAAFTK